MKKINLTLRVKIIVILCLLSSLTSVSFTMISYLNLKRELLHELCGRLKNIAQVGAYSLDREACRRLVKKMAPGFDLTRLDGEKEFLLGDNELLALATDRDYRTLTAQLNQIRDAEPDLILYAYTLVPTSKSGTARFVCDADALT